jgi:putative DNA primase/helicase
MTKSGSIKIINFIIALDKMASCGVYYDQEIEHMFYNNPLPKGDEMANRHVQDPTLQRFSDVTLERSLLGVVLIEGEIPESLRFLEPTDFYDSLNRMIFTAMRTLQDRGQVVDMTLVMDQMRQDKTLDELDRAGGLWYFNECLDLRPMSHAGETYARRLIDLAGKRRVWVQTLRFMADLANGKLDDLDADDVRARQVALLDRLRLAAPALTCATWADLEGLIGPIAWDWPGWLPRGFLTMLAGEAGLGKSILALRLCACYLRGDDWPDGTPRDKAATGHNGAVVWCEAEAAQVLNWERARAWGLPLERILAPLGALEDVSIDVPAHREAISRLAHRPEVGLVVVDSFSGASRRDENSSESLAAVRWLAALARDTGKPVLLLHHLRKRGLLDGDHKVSLERLRGHSSIVQPARTVLALDAPDPKRAERRRLSVIKSNLAPFPEPLGFWVTERGEVRFGEAPEAPQTLTVLDRAMEALRDMLGGGPVPAEEAMGDLRESGLSEKTIRRAKTKLGVRSDKERGGWVWALPSDEP